MLTFEVRERAENSQALRRAGKIPAVFYGRRERATPIAVLQKAFEKVWKEAGENAIVVLSGSSGEFPSLIHDVARHPVSGAFLHADFYVFEKGQKLKVRVPLDFVGVASAVKDLGGVLVKVMHELEIEAEPKNLPQKIEADVTPLTAFGSVIMARDVVLPPHVTLVTSPHEVVASVYEPKEEGVPEAPPDLSQIEVEKKGKAPPAEEGDTAKESAAAPGKEKEER